MSTTLLIGFGLLIGVFARQHPAASAGVVLGGHGYLSTLGLVTGLPWSAVGVVGVISGLVFGALVRWQNQVESFSVYRRLIYPIALLGCVFAIGAFQEYARVSGGFLPSLADAEGTKRLSELSERFEENGTWTVITRWGPYMSVALLGCILGGPGRFLTAFSFSAVLQVAVIPYSFYIKYFQAIAANGLMNGFHWGAINNAYLGYECSIAASWFLLKALECAKFREAWSLYLFSFLALLLVVLSWSKGPLLAMVLSIVAISIGEFRYRFSRVGALRSAVLLLVILFGVAVFLSHGYYVVSQFASKIVTSLRINESLAIRWEILSGLPLPSAGDLPSWLFGRGFGWSRWQMGPDGGPPIFVGSGTHVFFLDALLDVGIVGLLLIATSILLIYFIIPQEFATCDNQARFLTRFFPLFCVTLLIKMLFASDTYSEPLVAVFFGLLFGRAAQYLGYHQHSPPIKPRL